MKIDDIKKIDIKEFRKKGYLQELNRLFLHHLGLALEVIKDSDGIESLGGVWDCRDDQEGIYFNLLDSEPERLLRFRKNESFIKSELKRRSKDRFTKLGFLIEPIKD